ncbi:MAG: sensor histidine kinase [Novosphingobium sp.]|nr:sensor histidine kinase [Novosphingobium sp.]
MTQGENGGVTARLDGLVETVIAPYRSENAHCTIEGPSVALSERQVVPVGLVLHELVTNAVKYGAWSQPGGDIAIRWELAGDKPHRLRLEWREHCDQAPEPSNGKRGFGSMLLQSSARQLDGEWTRELEDDGIAVTLSFPLEEPAA